MMRRTSVNPQAALCVRERARDGSVGIGHSGGLTGSCRRCGRCCCSGLVTKGSEVPSQMP